MPQHIARVARMGGARGERRRGETARGAPARRDGCFEVTLGSASAIKNGDLNILLLP